MAVMLQSKLAESLAQLDRMILSYEARIELLEEENKELQEEIIKLGEDKRCKVR